MDSTPDTDPSGNMARERASRVTSVKTSAIQSRPAVSALYFPAGKLAGKVALITGGDSGLGEAVSYLYAREGADIVLTHLPKDADEAARTASAVEAVGQRALCLALDPRDPSACQRAVAQAAEEMGRLDILVNNATVSRPGCSIEELTPQQWEETLRMNLDSYFYMTKAALPYLRSESTIINTGAIEGLGGAPGSLDYAASKGAIHAFTKSLAQDLAPQGIRVNCVAPGPLAHADEVWDQRQKPMGRPARPEEIAPAFVYFASLDSSYVSGAVLSLPGGESLC